MAAVDRPPSAQEEEEEEEEEATSSKCSSFSPGVWVLPEEYMGRSPSSTHYLVIQWIHVPAAVPEVFGTNSTQFLRAGGVVGLWASIVVLMVLASLVFSLLLLLTEVHPDCDDYLIHRS